MSWLTEFTDAAAFRERAERSLTLPLGLANPVLFAFGAAASAGAAWWLMTRWTSRVANLEALVGAPASADAVEVGEQVLALAPAPAADETGVSPGEPASNEVACGTATVEAMPAAPDAVARPADDLTRLTGVGPKTAAALAGRGVRTFADLAAWTPEDMAAFDAALNLKGRSIRDAWLAQARRLAADA